MRRLLVPFLALTGMCAVTAAAAAADLPGSHDPQYLKRFQGSDIVNFVTRSFDRYTFALGPGTPGGGFTKMEAMEGKVTRVIYHIPQGHTALELLRNYEHMLTDAGLKQTYELAPCASLNWGGYFVDKAYGQDGPMDNTPYHAMGNGCYVYFKGVKDGKTVGVAVLVAEMNADQNFHPTGTAMTIPIKNGDVIVGVDEVIVTPVANGMTK
ncbi:MAG TPA: hypothetical protein VG867_10925 [Rhizomicrobium sp.]|nr:hypothetical protein [Rhizomicrobium sp.]